MNAAHQAATGATGHPRATRNSAISSREKAGIDIVPVAGNAKPSGRDRVDESTAPLLALETMPDMDPLSAEAIIRDRMSNQNGDSQMGDVVNGQLAPGVGLTGWAFTIDTEFSRGTRTEHGTAAIRLTGDPSRPYFVLWRRETPE